MGVMRYHLNILDGIRLNSHRITDDVEYSFLGIMSNWLQDLNKDSFKDRFTRM